MVLITIENIQLVLETDNEPYQLSPIVRCFQLICINHAPTT
jgi:hypothetical protein